MKKLLLFLMLFICTSPICLAETNLLTKIGYNLYQHPFESTVNLIDNSPFTIQVERKSMHPYYLVKVLENGKEVFRTPLNGEWGSLYYSKTRESETDLVALMLGGNGAFLNDFKIIGHLGNGEIGVIKTTSEISDSITNPTLNEKEGKIGIEYSPSGYITKFRVDLTWNQDLRAFIPSSEYKISKKPTPPSVNKEVYFTQSSYYNRIKFFIPYQNENINISEFHIKPGEQLLVRPANEVEERKIYYWQHLVNNSIINVEYRDGYYLITGKSPGKTQLCLFVPHMAGTTQNTLNIIVEQ